MASSDDISRLAAQKLHELFARATEWQESFGVKIGTQTADLRVTFVLGGLSHSLALQTTSLGQPREIRGAIGRLGEIRRELGDAYAMAVAPYISPQSASLLKRNGIGYLDLSGNCFLSFAHVQIEK